jgi:protein-tyrosine-phosphatase
MGEIGVDISVQESETLGRYLGESLELVITVCDDANEACPVFPVATKSACGSSETCGMRSEPVSKANWRNLGVIPTWLPLERHQRRTDCYHRLRDGATDTRSFRDRLRHDAPRPARR